MFLKTNHNIFISNMFDIYWILSPKNILRERKNEFGFFEGKKFILVFLNIIILTKYQNNKIQYIWKQSIFNIDKKNQPHRDFLQIIKTLQFCYLWVN